jgi:hypothetical protein
MSTEVGGRAEARRRRTSYRRAAAGTVGVLAAVALLLGVVGSLQGPRLSATAFDAAAATERGGQRLVLTFDQPIDPVDAAQVRITPDAQVELATDGRVLTVRFAAALRFDAQYRVEVEATGAGTGRTATATYEVITPTATVTALVRDPEGPDRIERRTLGGDSPEVLVSADRIQEYALLPDAVAYVELVADDSAALRIAPLSTPTVVDIGLPGPGSVTRLDSSGRSGLIGYTFTSALGPDLAAEYVAVLFVFDPLDPTGLPRPVLGLDGLPLQVIDWTFVPGTTSLIAQAFDTTLLLVDALGEADPIPLGQHTELRGFLPSTTALVVADPTSGATIDLATGETRTLELPESGVAPGAYETDLIVLGPTSYVQVVASPISAQDPFRFVFEVIAVDDDGARRIYLPPDDDAVIREICVSPNGQYLAVSISDRGGRSDDYPAVPSFEGVSTYIVDIAGGTSAGGVTGFALNWCS